MTIKRYGIDGGTGTGGQHLPFSRAVEAGGWLYISGQTPMKDGEVVEGGLSISLAWRSKTAWILWRKRDMAWKTWCTLRSF